ncbi:DUF1573 domain-containing protein [Planctomycetota bacterium]
MRHNCFTLFALIVAFVLLLQIGCQEQAKTSEQPIAVLAKSEPTTGQQEAVTTLQTGQPTPEITFEKVLHDFGEVPPRKKQVGEFKFTNTGDDLLKITEVKKCCGVVAKLDKEEIPPGESGVLKVEYRSGQRAGTMSKKLYVSSNDQINPMVALAIKAKIVPKVAYQPQRMKLLLKGENAGCPEIILTSLDNQPFSINGFKSTGNGISADIDSCVEATKFVLQPKVDLEKLQSRSSGSISINLTHPQCETVSIYYSVLPRFQSTPRSITISNAGSKKSIVKKIIVQSNYDEDFEIDSVSSKNDFVKFLGQEKIPNGYQLEVEITLPPANDTARFMDRIYVNIKGQESLQILCYELRSRKQASSGEKTGEFKNLVKSKNTKQKEI